MRGINSVDYGRTSSGHLINNSGNNNINEQKLSMGRSSSVSDDYIVEEDEDNYMEGSSISSHGDSDDEDDYDNYVIDDDGINQFGSIKSNTRKRTRGRPRRLSVEHRASRRNQAVAVTSDAAELNESNSHISVSSRGRKVRMQYNPSDFV